MLARSAVFLPIALALLSGCFARNWLSGPTALVSEQQVAAALGERLPATDVFDPTSVPKISLPKRARPCCAFGMDLEVSLAGRRVPGYTVGNIIGAAELGHHEYDNGIVTLNQDLGRLATLEKNGLVYTCRGGFVDTAHVRDNADLTLFLAMRIVAALPGPAIIELEGDGAMRRVVLGAVPAELIERLDRWEVATTLAQWAAYHISIWHEIVTWYGYESFSGFSEKVSAFSPEDFYSNAVGMRIAGGILRSQRVHTRREWDSLMDAWIPLSLQRLGALPPGLGRRVMKSLDGRWWDSRKPVTDWTLVTRRNFDVGEHVVPWRFPDAKTPDDPVLAVACLAGPAALALEVPDRIGSMAITDLLSLDFEVGSWAPASFPFTDPAVRRVSASDFGRIAEAVRREAEKTLGAGFEHPGPAKASTLP